MKVTVHHNTTGKFSEIDKFILIPKKIWDYFELGESTYKIDGKRVKLRVYDVPCDCSGQMHTHRLIDLRDAWEDLGLSDAQEVEIEK